MHSWLVSYPGVWVQGILNIHICSVNYWLVLYRWYYLSCMVGIYYSPLYFNLLLPSLCFFQLVSTVFQFFRLPETGWVVSEACLHTREREIFGLLTARVVQKVYGKTGPFSHILCSFFQAIRRYIDRTDRSRRNKCVKILWGDVDRAARDHVDKSRSYAA